MRQYASTLIFELSKTLYLSHFITKQASKRTWGLDFFCRVCYSIGTVRQVKALKPRRPAGETHSTFF